MKQSLTLYLLSGTVLDTRVYTGTFLVNLDICVSATLLDSDNVFIFYPVIANVIIFKISYYFPPNFRM